MYNLRRAVWFLPYIRDAGEQQRRPLYVINRKAMQPVQLRAVDDDADLPVIGNDVDGLHGNLSLSVTYHFRGLTKMVRYAHSAACTFNLSSLAVILKGCF